MKLAKQKQKKRQKKKTEKIINIQQSSTNPKRALSIGERENGQIGRSRRILSKNLPEMKLKTNQKKNKKKARNKEMEKGFLGCN